MTAMIAHSPPPASQKPSIEARKAALEARLVALLDRMSGIEAELDSHQAKDWPDLATEREGDEVLETLGLSAQQERGMIEAALRRITLGTYGHCARCGAEIPTERLDLLPFTPFCSACAA
jgi:RNA polymerase-binding transcription factor DksA